ncbi:hypothetical protein SXCC_00912 [Gluconacetobacter sp. SXCC-1]|nr:hypothetical protein SXCC_00912 [Gluconacetobacter sp. SXCC-1]
MSDIIMPPEQEADYTPPASGQDPADRLELALNRIAFVLDRRGEQAALARPPMPEADLQALAANIDVLIARVRDVLGEDSPEGRKE